MKQQLHKHIRLSVLVGWGIAWNALLGLSIWLNGGLGQMRTSSAAWPTAIALVGSCVFCFLLLFSSGVQAWALKPMGQVAAIRKELWFLLLLAAGLGFATLYGVVGEAMRV